MASSVQLLAVLVMAVVAAVRGQAVVAIAHRGDNLNYPENTIEAFESALQLGADYVEVDTHTTADGYLVVIHDSTVDRTTNGTGPVADYTLEEIQALDAGSWFRPRFAGLQVPTFAAVAALVRSYNRSIYLDWKAATTETLYRELQQAGMEANVVVYGGPTQLKELQDLDRRIKPMPEAVSIEVLESHIALFDPLEVVAFNDDDFRDDIIARARAIPADVYVDRLGIRDIEPVWQDAVDRGATGIQSDRPGPLVEFLRARGLHL